MAVAPVGGGASAARPDAGLEAVVELTVPVFGEFALLPFVAAGVALFGA
jgi:hypothetical protein